MSYFEGKTHLQPLLFQLPNLNFPEYKSKFGAWEIQTPNFRNFHHFYPFFPSIHPFLTLAKTMGNLQGPGVLGLPNRRINGSLHVTPAFLAWIGTGWFMGPVDGGNQKTGSSNQLTSWGWLVVYPFIPLFNQAFRNIQLICSLQGLSHYSQLICSLSHYLPGVL